MLNNKKVIAVVPARGGSKSIPYKSIVPLGGRPLIAWPIATARAIRTIDRVIVSTDSERIAAVAREHNAEVYERPAHLATDASIVADALRDLIGRLEAEGEKPGYMLLLEATSPLRAPVDVERCLAELADTAVDSVATFTDAATKPAKAWVLEGNLARPYLNDVDPWAPRQLTPAAWELNGACYGFAVERLPKSGSNILFGNLRAVYMPRERSVDINDVLDLAFAEVLLQRGIR
jgi:N-acylneuraminate cytidylyltransferase